MPDAPKPKPVIVPPKPTPKPAPAPESAKPGIEHLKSGHAVASIADPHDPFPPKPLSENVVQVYYCEKRNIWYARIGPERLGQLGQGLDPHEALAECVSNIYRSQWQFDPKYRPTS